MLRAVVILLVVGIVGFTALRELSNHLKRPRLETLSFAEKGFALVFYHRGSAQRNAALFIAPHLEGQAREQEQAHFLATLEYGASRNSQVENSLMESLSWSADQSALILSKRKKDSFDDREALRLHWIYDLYTGELFDEEQAGQEALLKLLRLKGGSGAEIRHWHQLGKGGRKIYSWESTHWDRLINSPTQQFAN